MLMGAALAFQWPAVLYNGGLMGLQKQVLQNIITALFATLRNIGMILVLNFISPTIQAFFIWHICITILQTCVFAIFFWKSLPKTKTPASFDKKILSRIWKFAAGVSGISLIGLIFSNLDKIILSKLLSLEMFGYYSLAVLVANSLYHLVSPVFSTFFPHFSQLIALKKEEELKPFYHLGSQLLTVLVCPVAIFVIFFSKEILLFWTRNEKTVLETHQLVTILMISTVLNALLQIPYALQLAYGWTKLAFYQSLLGLIILGPLLFFATKYFQAVGAAYIWLLLNLGNFFISVPIMHKKILLQEKWTWYLQDIALPIASVFAIISLTKCFCPMNANIYIEFALLMAMLLLAYITAALVAPLIRKWGLQKFVNLQAFYKKKRPIA